MTREELTPGPYKYMFTYIYWVSAAASYEVIFTHNQAVQYSVQGGWLVVALDGSWGHTYKLIHEPTDDLHVYDDDDVDDDDVDDNNNEIGWEITAPLSRRRHC